MLNPKGDYTAYFADSDIFFRWPDILQILVPGAGGVSGGGSSSSSSGQAAQLPTCPICLSVSGQGTFAELAGLSRLADVDRLAAAAGSRRAADDQVRACASPPPPPLASSRRPLPKEGSIG